MSVFKKLKDVLFDVEEEEIPVITKEEKKPVREEPKREVNPIKEVKMPKEEVIPTRSSNFNFPLDDFEEEKPKTRVREVRDDFDFDYTPRRSAPVEPKKDERRMDYSKFLKEEPRKKDPSKPFKPTPIISPVYGILDQNYTKDDVIVKTDMGVKAPDLDEVRKKAYGVEEKKKKVSKETTKIEVEEDEFTEPLKSLDEILTSKDEDKKIDAEVIEEKDEPILEEAPVNETKEDTLENDLFNLIDSMYEEKNKEIEQINSLELVKECMKKALDIKSKRLYNINRGCTVDGRSQDY